MKFAEYDIKIYLLKDIHFSNVGERLGKLLNETLCQDSSWQKIHYNKSFKGYVFNYLYPIEKEKKYKTGKVYNFQCRTMNSKVENLFDEFLSTYQNSEFKVLTVNKKIITESRKIERVFSVTPLVVKNDSGYWKDRIDFIEYKKRIVNNLSNKFTSVTGSNTDNHDFISSIVIDNEKPIAISYKGKDFLGDKFTIKVKQDELSQKMIVVALAFGLGELNSMLGNGFLNYKYIL